jgi:drug/metabolite transporter (DMT)-like permease
VRGRTLGGILLGLGGLVLVAGPALQGRLDGPGLVAILCAALVCGTTATLIKRHSSGWHIPSTLTLQFALNAAAGALLAWATHEAAAHWTRPALGALAYLVVVCSVGAYAGIYWLYRHMNAISITMMVLADATMALLLGSLWLREALTWRIVAAAAAVLAGFLLTVTGRVRAA